MTTPSNPNEELQDLFDRVWQHGSRSAGGFHITGRPLTVAEAMSLAWPLITTREAQAVKDAWREELRLANTWSLTANLSNASRHKWAVYHAERLDTFTQQPTKEVDSEQSIS